MPVGIVLSNIAIISSGSASVVISQSFGVLAMMESLTHPPTTKASKPHSSILSKIRAAPLSIIISKKSLLFTHPI